MAKIPNMSVVERIDAVTLENYPRPHLGASQLGHACSRYLVYSFYWAYKKQIPGKLNRIFRLGDKIEDLIIDALESIGIKHYGGQDRILFGHDHGGGSVDGILSNVPDFEGEELLFEAKSMNHNNYLEVKRKGVQESKPVYYSQMQMYMGEMDLRFGLFAAMDKNTSDLYVEFVPYDEDHHMELKMKADDILSATHINEFPKIGSNPSWFQCKFCDAKDVCHGGGVIEKNCRTCQHSLMLPEGMWECLYQPCELNDEEQARGCSHHQYSDKWGLEKADE